MVSKTFILPPTPAGIQGRKEFVEVSETELWCHCQLSLYNPATFFSTAILLTRELWGQGQDLCLNTKKTNRKSSILQFETVNSGEISIVLSDNRELAVSQYLRLNQLTSFETNSENSSLQKLLCVLSSPHRFGFFHPLT